MHDSANAAAYFVDRHLAEGRADKPAFREAAGARRSLSYGQLAEASDRVAGALSRVGIAREERAIMLMLDQVEFPQVFWGALKAGVIPVPLNTLLSTDVYAHILNDSRAACLFVSAELLPVVLPAALATPSLRRIVVVGGDAPEGTVGFDAFMEGAQPAPMAQVSPDECAFWLYSSGSTGQPKGVRHVHASLRATSDTYGARVLGIEEGDIV
ncbi:MAG: benzoate-CoA ligase family protein, partial [Rhodobacteraceae bacterium]